MKNLEVHHFNVIELNSLELASVSGGGWWADFKSGFLDTLNRLFDGFAEGFL